MGKKQGRKSAFKLNTESLLNWRTQNGLTQEAAAEKIGFDVATLKRWESGKNSPRINNLKILADAMGFSSIEEICCPLEQHVSSSPHLDLKCNRRKKYKLIAFDVDGTLITGENFEYSWQRVWAYLAPNDLERKQLMQSYVKEEIDYVQWCKACEDAFKRYELKKSDFDHISSDVALRNNASTVLQKLKDDGFIMILISGGIDTFTHHLLGDNIKFFSEIFINEFEYHEKDGALFKIIPTPYDFEGKLDAIKRTCKQYGITKDEVVFVGDNFNDFHVCKGNVGSTITFEDAAPNVRAAFDHVIPADRFEHILGCLYMDYPHYP